MFHLQTLKRSIKVNEEMMEKYGTKNSSPKVDGKRAAKENDSAKLMNWNMQEIKSIKIGAGSNPALSARETLCPVLNDGVFVCSELTPPLLQS